jgi:uncharacterized protein with HEPN domain
MTRHNEQVYLEHMLSHAREALSLLGDKSPEVLAGDRVLLLALCQLLEIIGEAASRIAPEIRAQLGNIEWRGAISMRNRIIHGYDTVDAATLWDTITQDLPGFIQELEVLQDKGER